MVKCPGGSNTGAENTGALVELLGVTVFLGCWKEVPYGKGGVHYYGESEQDCCDG